VKTRPPKILVIKSDISELEKVEDFIIGIFAENNVSEKNFNKTYLCVSEAVINAIKHGNKNDLHKKVSIVADCIGTEIIIQIEDEGEGFNINEVKDPTQKENIKKESGRGIYIIKNLSKKIEYNEKGNRVQLKIECK
jgi:serine/threonine-protein kinase RsbW